MEKIRAFIAVLLSDEIRGLLAEIEEELMASCADVKWVPRDNFHITLKFLGNVDEDRLGAISEAIRPVAEETHSFDACLAGTGAFPGLSRPNVIWIGITTGADQLKTLAAQLDDALEKLGFPREKREFNSHMTLGRARSMRGAEKLREAIENSRETVAGSFRVESIALMKSDLHPNGPIYTPISTYALR